MTRIITNDVISTPSKAIFSFVLIRLIRGQKISATNCRKTGIAHWIKSHFQRLQTQNLRDHMSEAYMGIPHEAFQQSGSTWLNMGHHIQY